MSEEETMQDELPEEVIKHVGFTITPIEEGECCRCKEMAAVTRVTALVYYDAAVVGKPGGEVESLWSVDYCTYCLKELTRHDAAEEKDVDKMYI